MTVMRKIWFLIFDKFQLLDVCGPLQVFATANDECRLKGRVPLYVTRVAAVKARTYKSSSGVALSADALPARLRQPVDAVVVPGGPGAWNPHGPQLPDDTLPLVKWLQVNASRISRIASVCTGAFLLARTGLLDNRSAVTHWAACDALADNFSAINVQRNAIYFRDDPYWTSAGVTAGIDMALGMVEADGGRTLAMDVAKKLVVFYKRPGGQSQFSSALLAQSAGDVRIGELHRWLGGHLRDRIDIAVLAEKLSMTQRTFARFYLAATGVTPARAVEQMRLENACRLIESQALSTKAIAQQCGFSSEEIMRRAFLRTLHVSPMDYRQRFSGTK